MPSKLTTQEFIEKAKLIHGDKYDYSKVEYKNYETKICIICPIHGEFYQTPNKHLNGCGCPKCKGRYKTTEDYIRQAQLVHKDEYSYEKTKYIDYKTKVCITCKIHGDFWQLPNNHLQGKGCPVCGLSKHSKKSTDKFIQEATEKHNGKYDYSKTIYVRNTSKVIITCPKHGDFLQTPKDHLNGCGCPKCKRSLLEEETEKMLNKTSLSYFAQYRAKWLKLRSIDFYIPSLNLAIECQGQQHYQSVEIFGGEKALNDNIQRDKIKKEICLKHNISILYVFPNDANIEQIIENLPEIYINKNTIHLSDFNDYIKKILK